MFPLPFTYTQIGGKIYFSQKTDPTRLDLRKSKEYRDHILLEQGGLCPITSRVIKQSKAVLDHSHYVCGDDGYAKESNHLPIRGVLSSRGNKWEGVVSRLLVTYRVPFNSWADFLSAPPSEFVHCLYYEYKSLFDPDTDLSFQEMINSLVEYWNRETNYLTYPRKIRKCQTPTLH